MASKRNRIDCRSVIRNFFERLMSICLYPGPRSVEMPQVPRPEVGIDMVVGSNQMYPLPMKFLYGVAFEGASQFGRGWKEVLVGSPWNWIMEMGNPPCTLKMVS